MNCSLLPVNKVNTVNKVNKSLCCAKSQYQIAGLALLTGGRKARPCYPLSFIIYHFGGGATPPFISMPLRPSAAIDFANIDLVLFDLDGTLLDLYFENHFWQQALPEVLAGRWDMPLAETKTKLLDMQAQVAGQLPWYNVAYWSDKLDLDLTPLREQLIHLAQPRPGAIALLEQLRERGCPAWLATNTCRPSLDLKLEHVPLAPLLERLVTAHELGAAKQTRAFWERLFAGLPVRPQRCLFIDDTGAMLAAAQDYGIGHLRGISRPDSKAAPAPRNGFIALDDFADLSA